MCAPLVAADAGETRNAIVAAICSRRDPVARVGVGHRRAVGGRVDHRRQDRVRADAVAARTRRRARRRGRAPRAWRSRRRRRRRTAAARCARRRRRSIPRRRRASPAAPRAVTSQAARRFSRSWPSSSSTGVSCRRPPAAKPPTRLTTARVESPATRATSATACVVEQVGLDELEALVRARRARARARRPTARRRASRPRSRRATTAAPRPPVPPVTIAVCVRSASLIATSESDANTTPSAPDAAVRRQLCHAPAPAARGDP